MNPGRRGAFTPLGSIAPSSLGKNSPKYRYSATFPGRYIANASAVLVSNDSEVHLVDCFFTLDGKIRGERALGNVTAAPNGFVTLPLTIGFILRSPHDLGLACSVDSPGTVKSLPSPISVIRVDTLRVEGFRIIED